MLETKLKKTIATSALALTLAGTALALNYNDVLAGTNTVDYTTSFHANEGHAITYRFTGTGKGSNTLYLKVQQKKDGSSWKTVHSDSLAVSSSGTSKSGSFTVNNVRSGSDELIRYRLSRKLGTKKIVWKLTDSE